MLVTKIEFTKKYRDALEREKDALEKVRMIVNLKKNI
jgi:hypothetical protein